jgi:colicin import membrane protein
MQRTLTGLSLMLLASAAIAQTPAPVAEAAAPAVVQTPAEMAAAQKRAAEDAKKADEARARAEKQAKEQERQVEKQREASEKQAREQKKAEEARAAETAVAAQKTATADAAKAKADAEAAAALAAAQKSGDVRDIATQVCLAEAKSRAMAIGAANVTMNEVKDTDKKSDGRASVTAKVNVITMNKDKPKAQSKKIECETRNGVVTKFKWN